MAVSDKPCLSLTIIFLKFSNPVVNDNMSTSKEKGEHGNEKSICGIANRIHVYDPPNVWIPDRCRVRNTCFFRVFPGVDFNTCTDFAVPGPDWMPGFFMPEGTQNEGADRQGSGRQAKRRRVRRQRFSDLTMFPRHTKTTEKNLKR